MPFVCPFVCESISGLLIIQSNPSFGLVGQGEPRPGALSDCPLWAFVQRSNSL